MIEFRAEYDLDEDVYVIHFRTDEYEIFMRAKSGMTYGIEQALADELEKLEENAV